LGDAIMPFTEEDVIGRAKRMKTTARHSESPGKDNQAGRGTRDPPPEFEADPKGIRGSSTNPGANSSSAIGRRIRVLVRPWPPQSCWRGTGSGSRMRPYEWVSLTQEIGGRPGSIEDTGDGGNRSSIAERGCRGLVPITTGLKREALGGSS